MTFPCPFCASDQVVDGACAQCGTAISDVSAPVKRGRPSNVAKPPATPVLPKTRRVKMARPRRERVRLAQVPCPVCRTPFRPEVIRRAGNRQETCSHRCSRLQLTGTSYLAGRWSRDHDACICCDETVSPHKARGVCNRCYLAARRVAA